MANPRPETNLSRLTDLMIEQGKRLSKMPALTLFDANGKEITGPEATFRVGERVVVKGGTYKVVYLNSKQVTLEPVDMVLDATEGDQ